MADAVVAVSEFCNALAALVVACSSDSFAAVAYSFALASDFDALEADVEAAVLLSLAAFLYCSALLSELAAVVSDCFALDALDAASVALADACKADVFA